MRKFFITLFVVLLLICVGTGFLALEFLNQAPKGEGKDIIFEVQPGSFVQVVQDLEQKKLITNALYFRILAKVSGKDRRTRVGEYLVKDNMTPVQILGIISSGKSIEYSFTVQEGWNVFEIAESLELKSLGSKEKFLKLTKDKKLIKELLGEDLPSLEGYLFPETYRITKRTGEKGLIQMMVNMFHSQYAKVMEKNPPIKLPKHQHVILASMIEKETGAPEERPMISSVFHNRLNIPMRLQSDPTTIYGLWVQTGLYTKNLTREDLQTYTKYNTYRVDGLPFGPIANPGYAALLAAVNPVTSKNLYFVSRNDGTHVFSESLDQHNKAVRNFQINKVNREGHSWKELTHKLDQRKLEKPKKIKK